MKNKEYIHYKNGRTYTVKGECKIQINSVWKEAVLYCEYGEEMLFVRELDEFLNKFREV